MEAVSVETDDAAALPATVRFSECAGDVKAFCSKSGGDEASGICGNACPAVVPGRSIGGSAGMGGGGGAAGGGRGASSAMVDVVF